MHAVIFCLGSSTTGHADPQDATHHPTQQRLELEDMVGEAAVLADAASFSLECGSSHKLYLSVGSKGTAGFCAQWQLSVCWCLRALQRVISRCASHSNKQQQRQQHVAPSPELALPHHTASAATAHHQRASKIALKLIVRCLPALLQQLSTEELCIPCTGVVEKEAQVGNMPQSASDAQKVETAPARSVTTEAAPATEGVTGGETPGAHQAQAVPELIAPTEAAVVDEALQLVCSCRGGSLYAHHLLVSLEAKLCAAAAGDHKSGGARMKRDMKVGLADSTSAQANEGGARCEDGIQDGRSGVGQDQVEGSGEKGGCNDVEMEGRGSEDGVCDAGFCEGGSGRDGTGDMKAGVGVPSAQRGKGLTNTIVDAVEGMTNDRCGKKRGKAIHC